MIRKRLFFGVVFLAIVALVFGACAKPGPTPEPSPTPVEELAIKDAVDARDAVLKYLRQNEGHNAPGEDLVWQEEDTTPPGRVGSANKYFTANEWIVAVSYPVVRPDLTVYKITVSSSKLGWHWKGSVETDGTVTETSALRQMTEEESRKIAEEFLKASPTFVYDGIEDTLKLVDTLRARRPYGWVFIFEFESRNSGYGDRTGQMLATVITPHQAAITVEQLEVISAVIDKKWDMLKQEELLPTGDSGHDDIKGEPDFTGLITEIHPIGERGILGQILVESQADKFVEKYMVTINDDTEIFEEDGEELHQVTFEALETKQQVQIRFTGPVMESFPMQATAQQVVITR